MIEAQTVVEDALGAASRAGADACIVLVDETSHADVRFALNTTTTNGVRRDRSVTVIVITSAGGSEGPWCVGTARRSGVADVGEMVNAALADAREAQPADDAAPLVLGSASAASTFGQAPVETDLSVLSGVLSGLSGAFERARARDIVLAGFAEYGVSTLYVGSSTGLRVSWVQPTGAVNLVGRSPDGGRSAWTGAGAEDMASLSFGAMEDELWRRLEWAAAPPIALEAGRYEVILPPSGVADMMGSLLFYGMGGQDAEDGRTVFSAPPTGPGLPGRTRVGDRLSDIHFSLYSDPTEPGLACLPFAATGASSSEASIFDNGLPLARTDWVHDGVLNQLRYHRAGAERSGVPVAPYIDNLILRAAPSEGLGHADGSGGTVDEMVARTERGLLLTCLWYIREVDPATLLLTGLTRDGVYVIEDGVVVGAGNNFRFNESPVDLLARTIEVGTPVRALGRELGEYLNRTIMPPLRIPDFNMSSVSQAS
ncbi:MAG TPA: metallopeptidase TldD-related protein [Acidimicrobiales bacterium]|jgi:predicted Zn-dependent protease|nr:metallopeptidase TldD-related protein [Acidimicrobiales bacterium]